MAKRLFDLLLVLLTLPMWGFLLLAIAVLVRLRLGKPVFFFQERTGFLAKPFYVLKFRSMTEGMDAAGNLLPDAKRITAFGRFLRSTSLDELPELINVLKGEMSLVGPRPLLVRYLSRYSPRQARRHEVRPGLTGWVQINGRNALSWDEKFELDVWYVENRTFLLDLKILLLTAKAVIAREGISAGESATMPEFMGSGCRESKEAP